MFLVCLLQIWSQLIENLKKIKKNTWSSRIFDDISVSLVLNETDLLIVILFSSNIFASPSIAWKQNKNKEICQWDNYPQGSKKNNTASWPTNNEQNQKS